MQLNDPVRPRLMLGPWHDQGVGHRRSIRLQPGLLGQQIALHTARTGGEQHGGVHQTRTRIGGRGLQYPKSFSDFLVEAWDQAQFALLNIDIAHGH